MIWFEIPGLRTSKEFSGENSRGSKPGMTVFFLNKPDTKGITFPHPVYTATCT